MEEEEEEEEEGGGLSDMQSTLQKRETRREGGKEEVVKKYHEVEFQQNFVLPIHRYCTVITKFDIFYPRTCVCVIEKNSAVRRASLLLEYGPYEYSAATKSIPDQTPKMCAICAEKMSICSLCAQTGHFYIINRQAKFATVFDSLFFYFLLTQTGHFLDTLTSFMCKKNL